MEQKQGRLMMQKMVVAQGKAKEGLILEMMTAQSKIYVWVDLKEELEKELRLEKRVLVWVAGKEELEKELRLEKWGLDLVQQ